MEGLPSRTRVRVLARIEEMSNDLKGDVKRLTDFSPEYRLRVTDYRVLFDVEGEMVIIYRIRHRGTAYR